MIRRMQLVELEDLPWFPAPIRDAGTDFLRFALVAGNTYGPAAPILAGVLRAAGTNRVVDLCSGGGGPWQRLLPALAAEGVSCDVLLTDRYPNAAALDGLAAAARRSGRLAYHPRPVDALAVPPELSGVRTLFTALHHFPPDAARALIGDAVRSRSPIAIFEATERSVSSILLTLLSPLIVLLATPRIRPFRWSRLLLTYLLPVVPMMVLWDGLVSCLRSYTVAELRSLVEDIPETEGYDWQVGVARGGASPAGMTYLVGTPRGKPAGLTARENHQV